MQSIFQETILSVFSWSFLILFHNTLLIQARKICYYFLLCSYPLPRVLMKSVRRLGIVRWLTEVLGVTVRNRRMSYLQAELPSWILSAASELPSLYSVCNTACKYVNLWGRFVFYSLKRSTLFLFFWLLELFSFV